MDALRRILVSKAAMAIMLAAAEGALASFAIAQGRNDGERGLVGTYDGGQTEMAAALELRVDGRFRYALSYGALDEEAEGGWTSQGSGVLLTSDPVTPPRFVLLQVRRTSDNQLSVKLDLPRGMSGQYFQVEARLADGTSVSRQLTENGDLPAFTPAVQATSVRLLLPIQDFNSAEVRLAGVGGHELRFRFEPNDLGKVAFARTALANDDGDLVLRRYDRTIRFRRQPASEPVR
jgi:hypothetical protein